MRTDALIALAFLVGTAACAQRVQNPAVDLGITTDSSRLAVPGGEIWYRVVGGGPGRPVILLHGGPGVSSYHMKPLEALGDDRLVVRYDQLGSGKSDVVMDTSLFNIGRFVEELETLRRHLRFDRVHLCGHSWGATLAVEYYRLHPEHVASLVLASSALDMPAFDHHLRRLMATLPDSMQRAVRLREAGQEHDVATYGAAALEFNTRYGMRRPLLPADQDSMMASFNPAINDYLMGLGWTITGTLKQYDATPFLNEITAPVLFTVGEFDLVGPDLVKHHASLTPGARVVVIPGAAHMTHWDNAPASLEAVRTFLRDVDP